VSLARRKLLNRSGPFRPSSKHHVLACFSQRISLETGLGETSTLHAIEAVQSHMRILLGAADRAIVHTRVPPEPMLSIMACKLLNANKDQYIEAVHTLIQKIVVQSVIIDCGKQGKLFVAEQSSCKY
jgi:hypothetical protein